MELKLNDQGNPESALFAALAGRRIDLIAEGASHPRQVIASSARNVAASIKIVLDALEGLPTLWVKSPNIDSKALRDGYRRLIYDATELFDVYSQVIPNKFEKHGLSRAAIADYRRVAKRLRDPWALMCNKFKHAGSRIAFNTATSSLGPAHSHGYMILSPRDGTSMLRDEQIHKPPERRTTFPKALHELLHSILRIDWNAAKLARTTLDGSVPAQPDTSLEFPFGEAIKRLRAMPVYIAAERATYDAVTLPGDGTVGLVRSKGIPLLGVLNFSTQFEGDGHSTTFSLS